MTQPIKLYWSSGLKDGKKNFGDWLSPVLCEAISGRKVVYAKPHDCDLVAIGSILHRLKNHFWTRPVNVWGSGLIESSRPFKTRHKIHAVRGHLTAEAILNCKPQTFGDPGLLCNILLPSEKIIKHNKIGLIPHYKDRNNLEIIELSKKSDVIVIDIFSDTLEFIEQVSKCHYVLSSSLHGLIVADALNIPNRWMKLSQKVRGNDFKFSDYYSIFGLKIAPLKLSQNTTTADIERWCSTYHRPGIELIKEKLYNAFPKEL